MPPAQLHLEPTRARGIVAVPAFILLPALMSLGYWLVSATRDTWQFQLEVPIVDSEIPFRFQPVFMLPFAGAVVEGQKPHFIVRAPAVPTADIAARVNRDL